MSMSAKECSFGMQVGKTLDQTNVKTFMQRVRQSRSSTRQTMPRQLNNNLKSEAFILKRSIPAEHVFAIRRKSQKLYFQKDRSSIASVQRYLCSSANQQKVVGSEFNLGIQNRIVQRLMSRLSSEPTSPSRVERVVSAPQIKEDPANNLQDSNQIPEMRKTVSQGRKRHRFPQTASSPVCINAESRPTTGGLNSQLKHLNLNEIIQGKPLINLEATEPMSPSIFDHESPRTPFGQTYNLFSKEDEPTVKVVYQAPYHSKNRLYDQAKRQQLKSRYLQQEAERTQRRITTTDISEKHQPMATQHTKDQNKLLNRLLKSNATTRQQFQNILSEQKAWTNETLKKQTDDVMQDIIRSPERNRPIKRFIDQTVVSLPRHRRISMLNELQASAADGSASLPFYGSFSPSSTRLATKPVSRKNIY